MSIVFLQDYRAECSFVTEGLFPSSLSAWPAPPPRTDLPQRYDPAPCPPAACCDASRRLMVW